MLFDQHIDFLSYLCEGKILAYTDFNTFMLKPVTPTSCELD